MLFHRMLRAIMLDQKLYDELRGDPIALAQAITVVLLASVAAALGAGLDGIVGGDRTFASGIGRGLTLMPGLWFIQAGAAYFVGSFTADTGKAGERALQSRHLVVSIGYSASPGVFLFFLFLPGAGPVVGALVFVVWMLVATLVAVKSVLGVSFWRAFTVVGPGFLLRFVLVAALAGSSSAS